MILGRWLRSVLIVVGAGGLLLLPLLLNGCAVVTPPKYRLPRELWHLIDGDGPGTTKGGGRERCVGHYVGWGKG